MDNLDLSQLQTLKAVVDEGTFDAAAVALHVTPSAISQRIKALETSVGRVLLQRTKPVTPTESGRELLALARQVESLTRDVIDRLGGNAPGARTTIPIAANADSLATWLIPALALAGDTALFEIHREDEEFSTALLHEGTVMAAITSLSTPVPGCRSVSLGSMRYQPMASASFVQTWFPEGATAKALAQAPVVMFDRKDDFQNRYLRKHLRKSVEPPRHYVPSTADFASAIQYGMGWGYISDLQMETFAKNHQLVAFDPGSILDVALYWQQWKLSSTALDHIATTICNYAKARLR